MRSQENEEDPLQRSENADSNPNKMGIVESLDKPDPSVKQEIEAHVERSPDDTGVEHSLTPDQDSAHQFREPEAWSANSRRSLFEQDDDYGPRAHRSAKRGRTPRLVAASVFLLLAVGAMVFAFYVLKPSRVKINLDAKRPTSTDSTARPDKAPDDLTAEAIAEVRSAIPRRPAETSQATAATPILPPRDKDLSASLTSSVLPADASDVTTDIAAPISKQPHDSDSPEGSRRNRERSIRFPPDEPPSIRKVSLNVPPAAPASAQSVNTPRRAERPKPSSKPAVDPFVLPSFGSILPVRTLGKIFTLRSGSPIRLELTRRVDGEGWSLAKGTTLIGQLRGNQRDRAFVAVTGYIDPSRDRFVAVAGEVLGDDGASGVRGQFHKLSSGWSRAFARVGSAAVNVAGAIAGGRISGQPVIITDIGSRTVSPFSYEIDSTLLQESRGFVEVPAGTAAFVMVTTLPGTVRAVDAEPEHLTNYSPDIVTAGANQPGALSQEELALLLTSRDTNRIREALPRMSPQMRQLAELMLADAERRSESQE